MRGKKTIVLPLVIFIALCAATAGTYLFVDKQFNHEHQETFAKERELVIGSIENRMSIYINSLKAGEGFISASDFVSREEFETYVNALELQENYPGIQGYGYSVIIDADEIEAHEEAVREEGFPLYEHFPEGDRDQYSSILYIEPFDVRNRQAFGFDMLSESNRNNAMTLAAETGEPYMSQRVTLVQEIDSDVQPGFLVYVPHYANGMPHDTLSERRDHIESYVYAAFRARDFMNNLVPEEITTIEFAIYDESGQVRDLDLLMYQSNEEGILATNSDLSNSNNYFIEEVELAHATWTIHFYSEVNESLLRTQQLVLFGILAGGIFLALVLALLFYFLSSGTARAQAIAVEMTNALAQEKARLQDTNSKLQMEAKKRQEAQDKLEENLNQIQKSNKLMTGREIKMMELKKEIKELRRQLGQADDPEDTNASSPTTT